MFSCRLIIIIIILVFTDKNTYKSSWLTYVSCVLHRRKETPLKKLTRAKRTANVRDPRTYTKIWPAISEETATFLRLKRGNGARFVRFYNLNYAKAKNAENIARWWWLRRTKQGEKLGLRGRRMDVYRCTEIRSVKFSSRFIKHYRQNDL